MATLNLPLDGTSYSNTIGGYKINNDYSCYGRTSFSSPVNITSATIYWGAYRSSGSGNSYGTITWYLGESEGTYSWSAKTTNQLTTGSFTVSCPHSNFTGVFDFDILTGGDVSSCQLGISAIVLNYTEASVTSYIRFYDGNTLCDQIIKTGTPNYLFSYYLIEGPEKTDHVFNGWSTTSGASSGIIGTDKVQNGTYGYNYSWYATWKYVISYDANNGTDAPSKQTKTHNVDLELSFTIPTREGYEFLGWATSASATSATYQPGGTYSSNSPVTLYAVWKAKEYSVLYNGNGGIHSGTGEKTWEDDTNKFTFGKDENVSLEALGDKGFKYPGYNLLGWNTSWSATKPLTILKIEKDEQPELYAIWKLGSNIRVYDGENWQIAIPYIYDGENWKLSVSKVFNGEEWSQ